MEQLDTWCPEQGPKENQQNCNFERVGCPNQTFDSTAAHLHSHIFFWWQWSPAGNKLARFLADAYQRMESNDLARLPRLGHKVASQYMALENEALRNDPNTTTWHIMPKLHMFQHIADAPCSPKEYWCYRDETVGGELAHLFRRRSGKNNPATNASNCLLMWQQENRFPAIPLD